MLSYEFFTNNITLLFSVRTSQVGGRGLPQLQTRTDNPPAPKSPKSQVFYAIVLHDFVAERADELDAKRGDPITVVAQSNREWFVAKPIGRLGRPGLIPVSFVEIHDPATGKAIPDVETLMDRGDLPKVEDWKRAMFNYKQNSIALGVIDSPSRDSVPNSPFMPQYSPVAPPSEPSIIVQGPSPQKPSYTKADPPPRLPTPDFLTDGILLSANVVSFHYEMEEYWFRIDAVFQPYSPLGQRKLPPAKQLILFRVYNDFYDFQVALLDTFPREAGRQPPNPRMLPYMPGPAQNVDDALTATRRSELDEYVRKLCDLNLAGAKYILEHRVVREFLALKPGDVENDTEARVQEMESLFGYDFSGQDEYSGRLGVAEEFGSEVRDTLGRMRMEDREEDEKSDGSEYEDEGYAPSPQRRAHDRDHHPYANEQRPSNNDNSSQNLRLHAHAQNHQRTGSTSSFHRAASPYSTNSRSSSPLPDRTNSPQPLRNYSPQPRSGPARSPLETDSRMGESLYSQSHRNDNNTGKNHPSSTPSTSSLRSSQAPSTSNRSHSQSNLNNPPISAANPQTSFVKIKIFDRVADDLIAIRVHPRVTHAELMDKVQARLGGEVANLRYRDSMSNAFVGIDGDEDLRAWMEGTDKHVLFAD